MQEWQTKNVKKAEQDLGVPEGEEKWPQPPTH